MVRRKSARKSEPVSATTQEEAASVGPFQIEIKEEENEIEILSDPKPFEQQANSELYDSKVENVPIMMIIDDDPPVETEQNENVKGSQAESSAGDDDPIVKEFPVYLSSKLADQLHLFQYPVRSAARPYTHASGEPILECRVKPQAGVVQVDVPIQQSRFYDREKADKWDMVDRQTLSGVMTTSEGYMVGVFLKDELHLTPLKGSVQLRPSFAYIDKDTQAERELARSVRLETTKSKEIRAVQMSIKATDGSAPRYSLALAAQKRAETEEFQTMRWNDKDTTDAWELAEQLQTKHKLVLEPSQPISSYLDFVSSQR
ncbi:Sin-like protein conserved region-domain-containing protein [Lipomyces oligophaga]|uniref:Sin-like protein conserved region-domain-containing protein n=1 Tax=Lipomyces oligophaga TaxID=45792 RepID=UPI0034CD17DF